MSKFFHIGCALAIAASLSGCATTETSKSVEVGKVEAASVSYRGPRVGAIVG